MSFMSDYKAAKKRLEGDGVQITSTASAAVRPGGMTTATTIAPVKKMSFMDEYRAEKKRLEEEQEKKERERFKAEDLGPVRSNKEDEEDKRLDFFQKGSFEDGYQVGDVTKAILGTAGDVGVNLVKGALGLGEGIVDLLGYGAAGVIDLAGDEEWADNLRLLARERLVDKAFKGADDYLNQYSVLGRTSDSIMQGVGQVGGIIATGGLGAAAGLGAGGVTALTTGMMGLSGMGSGMGEAYDSGATDKEALAYGAMAGAADAAWELVFGGLGKAVNAVGFSRGLSSLDDIAAKGVSKFISSPAGKNIVEALVKSGFEGLEEVGAGFTQAVAKKLTYMSEEEFSDIVKDENLLEQFIVGAFTSGIAQAPSVNIANQTKTDYVTGLTQNEQAVIQKEVENRIAEAEKDGKKLTAKEKSDIQTRVENDMEKGYISIDTIEEVLGGETYQRYKEAVDNETSLAEQQKALQEEFDTLNKMKQGEMTGEQIDRRIDLKEELAKLNETIESTKNHSIKGFLKQQLGESVSEMVRSDRLIESYNERGRRSQAYEADLTKYDVKQRAVIQKAAESGILNNTNRTHEFVDMIAKVSADKGVLFDFTNNEKLKNSGFAIDGKTVNGYVTQDGVTLNIDSAKALETVVGHEISHVLEGTEFYTELQTVLFEYAKTKGEFDSRRNSLAELYANIEGADIDAELTADLIGDYLFTDSDFVKNLSVQNRNVFQKIYDEIKYLYKMATAGSKEARELERVKKAFDEAYRANSKSDGDTKYSISEIVGDDQKSYGVGVHLDSTLLDNLTPDERKVMVKERIKELGGETFTAYDNNGSAVDITIAKPGAAFKNQNGKRRPVNNDLTTKYIGNEVKQEAVVLIDELITTSKFQGTNQAKHAHGWLDNNGQNDWDVWTTYLQDKNGTIWEARLHIANAANGEKIIYDVDPTKKVGQSGNSDTSLLNKNLSQDSENVKYSLSESNGEIPLAERLSGDALLDAEDLIAEIEGLAEISPNGYVTVYHRTTEENAKRILATGKMSAKEDGVFFSTQKDGEYSADYGKGIVELKVPVEKFVLDDIFDSEAHLRIPLENRRKILDVSEYLQNAKQTGSADIRHSLSISGDQTTRGRGTYGKDIALETAPVQETSDIAPVQTETTHPDAELKSLEAQLEEMSARMQEEGWDDSYEEVARKWQELNSRIAESDRERLESIEDSDAPPEPEATYADEENKTTIDDPFEDRDWYAVGRDKKQNTFMHDHPEFKPFFIEEAKILYGEYANTIRGERLYNDQVYYESGGEKGWDAQPRMTSKSMEVLLDKWGMKYSEIEKGLKAIIENDGESNLAAAKRIEFMLHDRLLNGYESSKYFQDGAEPNQEYIDFLRDWQARNGANNEESFDALMAEADRYAPPVTEDIGPVAAYSFDAAPVAESAMPATGEQQAMWPEPESQESTVSQRVAKILTEEPKAAKKESGVKAWIKNNVLDKGMVFEDLSLATGNRELQARWNSIRYAEGKAQRLIGNGNASTKSLDSIRKQVEKTGKTKEFYEYMYHLHNADRMTLAERFEGAENKAVFGDSMTAEKSRETARQIAKENPWVKQYAQDVYDYMGHLRDLLVENGVISKETAELWKDMYPHYVPIRRTTDTGLDINVPLDTKRTGVNAPIKKATGGSSDILPLFDTMGQRTIQTFKAIAKNRFGVELMNTLGTTVDSAAANVDNVIDSIDANEELLQAGKRGQKPTFTVFENGEKVTFEITEEMYDAMKPTSDALAYRNKVLNKANNFRRGLLTEYNPVFALRNPIKDTQDVLINSQHPLRTYANFPKAVAELFNPNGRWYREYMENGGEDNTYFERDTNTFTKEKTGIAKAIGMPLEAMSAVNNFIERIPRMAEYIASREVGRSIDVAMLDAARVTTNFAAGGDLTKFLNRNGATFLNASMQGAVQQVRNIREAKANGLKGVLGLAAKVAISGLPSILLNHLFWEDDEEYEELSDYVKQNYYIVAKNDDGTFVRIPKGRTLAVIQNAFEQVEQMANGEETDWGTVLELAISNLAPNNPLENHIFAPITQALQNKTWYGEDLVPSRLQDVPAAEQYDESTDSISKWLGEKLDVSPYKVNYLLDQYSGGVGDVFLPMLTPEAESGDDSFRDKAIAPLRDTFTTDSTMNNQNVTDFYDLKDELKVSANSMYATDEDKLKSMYMNAISSDLADMYAEKRELQNSDKSDSYKYKRTREIQSDIVEMMKDGMSSYQNISYDDEYRDGGRYARIGDKVFKLNDKTGEWYKLTDDQLTKYEVTSAAGNANYATNGTVHYRWDADDGWTKISDKQLERQDEVTRNLGITPEEYWDSTDISFIPKADGEYEFAYNYPENYAVAQAVGGYDSYKEHTGALYDLKADKDENGKSISGSRKDKVIDYINGLDMDYGMKLILFKNEYNSDDTYNNEIIDYLNDRDDISAEQMETILKRLGFEVSADGTITW